MVQTFTKALHTVDAKKATGRVFTLWVNFAKFYEEGGDPDNARKILEKGTRAEVGSVEGLANIWCHWAELEIRHG